MTNCETVVAREAPSTPIANPQSNIKTGSSTTLRAAPVTTAIDEIFTDDSCPGRAVHTLAGRLARAATNIQNA